MITETDLKHLRRCIELAETALEKGDEPFGSVLVSASGEVLFEDHNHVAGGDHTQHPEFAIARWAANNLSPEERGNATVYTSGEHCPMCAAAHGWVGLRRIVYASSSEQLAGWLSDLGAPPSPVRNLAISDILTDADVAGPVPELAEQVRSTAGCTRRKGEHSAVSFNSRPFHPPSFLSIVAIMEEHQKLTNSFGCSFFLQNRFY